MKTFKMLFAIAAALMFAFGTAQAQETQAVPGDPSAARASTGIAKQLAGGFYKGPYYVPQFRKENQAELTITKGEGDDIGPVKLVIYAVNACYKSLTTKAEIEGRTLKLTARAPMNNCPEIKVRLVVSQDAKQLDGDMDGEKMTLSR